MVSYVENVPEIKSSNFQNLKLVPCSPWHVLSEYVHPIGGFLVEVMLLDFFKYIQNRDPV